MNCPLMIAIVDSGQATLDTFKVIITTEGPSITVCGLIWPNSFNVFKTFSPLGPMLKLCLLMAATLNF